MKIRVVQNGLIITIVSPCGKQLSAFVKAEYIDELTGVDIVNAPADLLKMAADCVVADGETEFTEMHDVLKIK